jgi:hypothetical protein
MRSYELTCELVAGRTSARNASLVGGLGAGGWRSPALQVHRNTAHAVDSATTLAMPRRKQHGRAPDHRQMGQRQHRHCQGRAGRPLLGDNAPSLSPASRPRSVKKVWNVTVQ